MRIVPPAPMLHHQIELLSPARTADIGIEAINHGADAVYIGGPSFGARTSADNSVQDIGRLAKHAHRFGSRVFVTSGLSSIIPESALLVFRDGMQGAKPKARLYALPGFATRQTARKTTSPAGWGEIGRFAHQMACMGSQPMRRHVGGQLIPIAPQRGPGIIDDRP